MPTLRIIYPLSIVGLIVEFFEQEEEHNSVHSDPPNEGFRVVAVNKQKLEGVEHDSNKLNLKEFRSLDNLELWNGLDVSPFGDPSGISSTTSISGIAVPWRQTGSRCT